MKRLDIKLPDHSRIWIYQAERELTANEVDFITQNGQKFTATWAAHGNALLAELLVIDNHFIILALDEEMEMASGCSIDKAMKFILDLQHTLSINLTNRLISAFPIENKIALMDMAAVRAALKTGQLNGDSLVYDPTISTVKELKSSWLKPIYQTWLKKLLLPENVG